MSEDNHNNLVAKYSMLQGVINVNSQLIIQGFGFSIAAVFALIGVSVQAKNLFPLFGALLVILLSATYSSVKTRLIIELETYIVVFIESNLQDFRWKQRLFEKYMEQGNNNPKEIFQRLFIFSDFVALSIYIATLLPRAYVLLVTNSPNSFIRILLAALSLLIGLYLVKDLTRYTEEDYYSKFKKDWEKRKEQEELVNLEQLISRNPLQAKFVESNGKEFPIPESTYQVLHQVIQFI